MELCAYGIGEYGGIYCHRRTGRTQTSLESLGITSSQAWKVGSQENDTWNIQKMDTPLGSITEESELGAGEMCLYYNAATKKCYMLVGPQCAGVEGANLFAMNEAGTASGGTIFENIQVTCFIHIILRILQD